MENNFYTEIENFFNADLYQKILDFAKDESNYVLCGYDPNGFWDNRAKRIEPEEFRIQLTYNFKNKVSLPEGISDVNPVTLVKFADYEINGPDEKYTIPPHSFNNPPHYWDYQVIINLNDDYEGGEIEFPEQGIVIVQKPNSAICFKGDVVYQLNKVRSGKKYMITLFGK
jgi:hypothetical protein